VRGTRADRLWRPWERARSAAFACPPCVPRIRPLLTERATLRQTDPALAEGTCRSPTQDQPPLPSTDTHKHGAANKRMDLTVVAWHRAAPAGHAGRSPDL
jgi:hypothetical protein